MSATPPPFAHQKITLAKLKKSCEVFDMSDPGTGKTRSEVEDIAARRRKGAPPAIITATKSLLTSAWQEDFNKFAPDMRVSVAFAENREEAFAVDADVYVTNHDGVKWLADKQRGTKFWRRFEGGTIVHDESTAYKHHTSQRGKAAAKISKYFEFVRLMSGTPTPNGICDIWHQMLILDGGKRLGKLFSKFQMAACVPEKIQGIARGVKWVDREGIEQVIGLLLADVVVRHKFEDCVDIPANVVRQVNFKLTSKHRKLYDQMQLKQIMELEGKTINAINAAAVYGKLLQIASGALYDQDKLMQDVDSSRYELTLDLVEERKHSVVFFNWKHQRDNLIKEARKRNISFAVYDGDTGTLERTAIVNDFQAGKIRMVIAHPQSAGHGLTLTKATATIWSSPTRNYEHFQQGLKRIHRIGQTQKTETIVICGEDTVDQLAWADCQRKGIASNDLLTELKRMSRK